MSLAILGAQHLFSHMQQALFKKIKGRVLLRRNIHQALKDFLWLFSDITFCLACLAKLIFLAAAAKGYHYASGKGVGKI